MIQKPKCLRHTHISKINSPKFSDEGISGLYTPKLQKIQNPNLNSAQIINIQLSLHQSTHFHHFLHDQQYNHNIYQPYTTTTQSTMDNKI